MGDRLDREAFDMMEYATADKTAVDLLGDKPQVDKEDIHNMLMIFGFTPALGNIADAADALLYAAEGEFGAAGLSAAAMIPFIGQAVSTKKALKVAKESGEKMVTVYKGIEQWYPGDMVKSGKFISPGIKSTRTTRTGLEKWFYTTSNLDKAQWYAAGAEKAPNKWGRELWSETKGGERKILEFEIPESYVTKHGFDEVGRKLPKFSQSADETAIFKDGLPKEFLTKVHK